MEDFAYDPTHPTRLAGRETASDADGGAAAEGLSKDIDLFWDDLVPGPFASLFTLKQPGANEDRQMVAHGWLAATDWPDQFANADLSVGSVGDEAEKSKTHRVGQHLESAGKRLGLVDGDCVDQ